MNIHSTAPTDPDAFLRWNEGREGKRELVKGRVVEMMVNVTRWHAYIVAELMLVLLTSLDRTRFDVFSADFGMRTPSGIRYPDVVVDAAGGQGKDLAVTSPVFICEVLSSSSVVIDTVEKPGEYAAIPTVQNYLVLSQDEPRGWLWSREAKGWRGPEMLDRESGPVRLSALSVQFDLLALYPPALAG